MSSSFLPVFALKRLPGAVLLFSIACAGTLLAQGPDVRVELTGKRVVTSEGRESFVPAEKAQPGDIVQYEAICRNVGKEAARNVAATVPIPPGMALQAGTAKPAAQEASLDGKNFSAVPLMREVRNEAGVMENQPVPLAEYRALRWTLPELGAGETATVSLRVQILTSNNAR